MADFTISELINGLSGMTSTFIALGTIPAATGTLRLGNADDIVVRNQNDNGDFNVMSWDASANMDIGDAGNPRIRFAAGPIIQLSGNRLIVIGDNTGAFNVQTAAFANIFTVDTTNNEAELGLATDLIWQSDGSGNIGATDSTLRPGTIRAATDYAVGPSPATTGTFRFSTGGSIRWRNAADSGNLSVLAVSSDILTIAGVTRTEIETPLVVDLTSTEALLIRQNGDTGDILIVDTTNDEVQLGSATALQWSTDLKLFRDGPWELALRDGLNDNFFYVYGTFTDASNYERLALYAGSSTNHFLEPQTAGTGDDNINLFVRPAGTGLLTLGLQTVLSGGSIAYRAHSHLYEVGDSGGNYLTISARALSGALASGATFTFTGIIPVGAIVKTVMTRVGTLITGATAYDVGDGVDPDRWGAGIGVGVGSHSDPNDYTQAGDGPFYQGTVAGDVVLTAVTADFTAGEVVCIVVYEQANASSIS